MEPLATYDELTQHLGRPLDEDRANQALILASGAVRAYCRWDISYAAEAQFEVYGDGSHMISIPTLLLLDVISLSINLVDQGPITRSVDLMWSRKGQIHRTQGWCKDAVVNVVVEHGYAEIPDAVKLVTLDSASRQMVNPENLVSATVGEVSRSWSSSSGTATLTTLHQALLDNYRLFT